LGLTRKHIKEIRQRFSSKLIVVTPRQYASWFREIHGVHRFRQRDPQNLKSLDLYKLYYANIPHISIISYIVALEDGYVCGCMQESIDYEKYCKREGNEEFKKFL